MALRLIVRTARLVGCVVSPLLTAPAAGAEVERAMPAALLRTERPVALHVMNLPRPDAASGPGRRRPGR